MGKYTAGRIRETGKKRIETSRDELPKLNRARRVHPEKVERARPGEDKYRVVLSLGESSNE